MIKKDNNSISSVYNETTVIGKIYAGILKVYESYRKLLASGIPPLTLLKCKQSNLIDYKVYGNNKEPYDFNIVVSEKDTKRGIVFSNYQNDLQFDLNETYVPQEEDSFEFTYQVIDKADRRVIGEKTCTVSFYCYADEN